MLCCGTCKKMPKRDYKVSTLDGIELEPLGGSKFDKDNNKTNGVRYGGDSSGGRQTRNGVAVCSQKRAFCITCVVVGGLITTALIIAYAGPQNDCGCAGKMPPGFVAENYTNIVFNPIATNGEPYPWLESQLPNNVKPIRYTLTIHPNLTNLDVKGQVTIEFHVEKETNFIVLHIQDLNVTEKAVVGPKGFALKIVKVLEYPPRQQLYIELKDKLRRKTNFILNLRWYSRLVSEPEGFYVDEYEAVNGAKRNLAATVFRPGSARRAFPCFDEPHLRAPFKISLFRDRFHIGLSNSIVYATEDVGFYMGIGLLRDDFIETPPLPPDAIAWVVSDFQRESLESSLTYQRVTTTSTVMPMFTGKNKTAKELTDTFTYKRPIKNMLTSSLTKSLKQIAKPNGIIKNGNGLENKDGTNNVTNITSNGEHDDGGSGDILTAPSYTFYASEKILLRSGFVLHTSRDVLEYLQEWLGVAYPLTKLDFVALPSVDREMISSLGLITLQTGFLQDPDAITTEQYHMSAIKISEAIVKQFLGGITSPKIWKHSWLWDGLVKYLGRLVLVPLKSDWPMNEILLMHTTTQAMDIDTMQGWDSILMGTSQDGTNDDFYIDKSAAILAMLHSAIGEDNFRGCLGSLMNAYKFQYAEPLDLWIICTRKINNTRNIKEMMNLWTTLDGFPLVTVTMIGATVSISQKQFQPMDFEAILDEPDLMNITGSTTSSTTTSTSSTTTSTTTTTTQSPSSVMTSKKRLTSSKWIFPISYITNVENISNTLWFHNSDESFQMPSQVKWIKVNSDQNGYYRVLYDEDNWGNLIEQLKQKHEVLTAKDRIGIITDAFTLCHANLLSCNVTMNLLSYLPKEKNWGPMTTGIRHLERWRRILKYSECFLLLTDYIKAVLTGPVKQLGWKNVGNDEVRLLRPEILLASVLWEDGDSILRAKQLFDLITNGTAIPANLKEVAYTGSVLSGEYVYWQYCWERYTSLRGSAQGTTERMQLLRALGKTKDAWLQNRLLSHVVTLPPNEVVQVLEAIAGTPTGGAMACRFLQAKWFDLQAKLGHGTIHFAKVISAITKYGATKFDYDELKSLVHRFGDGPGMRTLNMTLRRVAANVEWVARSQTSIFNWVLNHEQQQHQQQQTIH